MTTKRLIVVAGATGRQGGAVAQRLLAGGWPVRALARHLRNPAARALAAQGAELVQADLNDPESLERAMTGAYGAFGVLVNSDREVQQGHALADAVKAAGVEHYVYSSADGVVRNSGLEEFERKLAIEQYLPALRLPTTILRPVFFMENFLRPSVLPYLRRGVLPYPLRANTAVQMVAVDDIAEFVALAFENPRDHIGKARGIAGDELTVAQAAAVFARVLGRPVRFIRVPSLPLVLARVMTRENSMLFQWLDEGKSFQVDIAAVKVPHPGLMTFEMWARKRLG